MPLVTPFRTSFGTETEKDVVVVRYRRGDGAEGWGECVALAEPTYSAEYAAGAHHVLEHHLLPRVLAGRDLDDVHGHPMAKAAVEMAVLDAELRSSGVSLAAHLGGVRDAVDAGVSVGMARTVDELVASVEAYLAEGYLRIKLKIEPGCDLEPVAAVRSAIGDAVLLQVDANAAYAAEDADHLARFDELGLLLIEQPLPARDLRGHAALAARLRTPVCLDESIVSARSAADAIAIGACSIVNIKAGRVGGYLEARRVHDVCVAAGIPVWCGGMLETGLGRAANVALAALPGFTLPGDTSASGRYYHRDITEPFVLDDGQLPVPTGPGLGVGIAQDVLDEVTTRSDWIPAS